MRFADFANSLEALEATSGRLEMYRLLGELFGKAAPEEVAPAAYLCEGRLLPAFEGVETGMGGRGVRPARRPGPRRRGVDPSDQAPAAVPHRSLRRPAPPGAHHGEGEHRGE